MSFFDNNRFRGNEPTNLTDLPFGGVMHSKIFTTPNNLIDKWYSTHRLFANVVKQSASFSGKHINKYFRDTDNPSEFLVKESGWYSILISYVENVNFANLSSNTTTNIVPAPVNGYDMRVDIQTAGNEYVESFDLDRFQTVSIPLSSTDTTLVPAYVLEHFYQKGDKIKFRGLFITTPDNLASLYLLISDYGFCNFVTTPAPVCISQNSVNETVSKQVSTANKQVPTDQTANKQVPTVISTPQPTINLDTIVVNPFSNNTKPVTAAPSPVSSVTAAPVPAAPVKTAPVKTAPVKTTPVKTTPTPTPIIVSPAGTSTPIVPENKAPVIVNTVLPISDIRPFLPQVENTQQSSKKDSTFFSGTKKFIKLFHRK
jgi:hypothetical protein